MIVPVATAPGKTVAKAPRHAVMATAKAAAVRGKIANAPQAIAAMTVAVNAASVRHR